MNFEINLFENDHALFEECDYRIINGLKCRLFFVVYENSSYEWYGYYVLVPTVENLSNEIKLQLLESDGLEEHQITEMDILHQVPELILKEGDPFYICEDLRDKEADALEIVNSFENNMNEFISKL